MDDIEDRSLDGGLAPQDVPTAPIDERLPLLDEAMQPAPMTGVDDGRSRERHRFGGAAVALAAVGGGLLGAALVAALMVGVFGLTPDAGKATRDTAKTSAAASATVTPVSATSTATASDAGTGATGATFAEAVAAKVTPAVVNISVEQTGVNAFTGKRVTQVTGDGSGVIIRSDGYILTNYHVIEGADALVVTVGVDDLKAKVIGTDPASDLAVIKVARTGLPTVSWGSSSTLKVGEPVVAIGSPFGLERSVTSGIVSALGRSSVAESATGLTAYTSLIQTDAAINPGNSGGALCDEEGRLIGINTLIQSTSGTSAGIGFAIPADFAKGIAEELIATGKVKHAYLGVGTVTVDSAIASQYGLSVDAGALVEQVTANSPADAAGIERGDIIVKLGGTKVTGVEDVFTVVRAHAVGDRLSVEVVRGSAHKTLHVTLGSDSGSGR